jgi:protein phosphatase
MSKKVLTLMVGNVASGKTTFARSRSNSSVIYLSSDKFRGVIGENESDQTVSKQVFEILRWNAEYFLKLVEFDGVVIDATNKTPRDRKPFIDIAQRNKASIVAFYFDVSLEICKTRNAARDRKVPEFIIDKFQKDLVVPSISEGFDYVYFLNDGGHCWQILQK